MAYSGNYATDDDAIESSTATSLFNSTSTIPYQWTNKWNTFCSPETDVVCANVPLYKCPTCRQYSFWLFFALILLLGIWILITNSFVIAWIVTATKRKRTTTMQYFKASLAVTDLLTGTMLLCVPLPNIVWTLQLTSREVYVEARKIADTPAAIVGSYFFMFLLTSTLYHLLLMSYNRFAAIMWPSLVQAPHGLKRKLAAVWIFAAVAASYPAWFPNSFHFYYIYFTFTFAPNISIRSVNQVAQAFGLFTIIFIPYLGMTILTAITACLIRKANQNARDLSATGTIRDRMIKREKKAYKTLTMMELGFTITLLPALIVLGLTYTKRGHPIAYIFMIYSALCNSAVNVLIYRAREAEFQRFIKMIFAKSKKKILFSLHQETGSSGV